MLILEGAQAGLSWYTILRRREGYRKVFKNFDPKKVAKMTDRELEQILKDERVIRNRLKIYGTRQNAQVFLEIQKEFGSFDKYIWSYVKGKPIKNPVKKLSDLPTTIPLAREISKDLKRRGMTFVGESIIYAYMQAVGITNDHMEVCFLR
jgi:DNA-3-methyladenine glycosylase I